MKEGVVFVEGQMDVLSAHQAGIKNALASSGTSLTPGQLKLLSRYTTDILFAFDSDSAGDKAMHRSIELAENQGFNIKVGIVPKKYKDMDEIIKADPKEAKQILADSVPAFDFYLASALGRHQAKDPIGKKKIMEELSPLFSKIGDPVLRDHYIKKISSEVGVSESVVADLISKKPAGGYSQAKEPGVTTSDLEITKRTPEEFILALVLKLPLESAQNTLHKLGQKDFTNEVLLEIFTELKTHLAKRKKKFEIQSFSEKLPEELRKSLDDLYLWDLEYIIDNPPVLERELESAVDKVKKAAAKREIKELSARIKHAEMGGDKKELKTLTKEFKELSEKLK